MSSWSQLKEKDITALVDVAEAGDEVVIVDHTEVASAMVEQAPLLLHHQLKTLGSSQHSVASSETSWAFSLISIHRYYLYVRPSGPSFKLEW